MKIVSFLQSIHKTGQVKAINQFGKEWEEDIKNEISIFPCVLIASFSNDIEFGEVYQFSSVTKLDFAPFFVN